MIVFIEIFEGVSDNFQSLMTRGIDVNECTRATAASPSATALSVEEHAATLLNQGNSTRSTDGGARDRGRGRALGKDRAVPEGPGPALPAADDGAASSPGAVR